MGLIGAAIGLVFVIGPALGGLLMPLGSTVPFWVAACAALLNALLVLILLPETRPRRANAVLVPGGTGALNMFISGWRNAARYPAVLRLVLINLLFIIAFSAMEGIFPLFAQHIFGWGAMQTGYIFTYVGIIVVIMQGGLVGRLVKRWGEHSLLIAGLALLVAGLILMAFSAQLSWLLITLAMLSIGDGAVTPTVSTLLSFTSPAEAQGETLGLSQGVGGLGRTIGPLAAGAAYTIGPGMPFIAGGILGAIALLIALPAFPIAHKEEQAPLEKETASAERQS
jgi:DHA1 family tetracycline resistance protein-like MFS transporter